MSHFTPSSSAPSTVSNRASSPAAWPSVRGRPRFWAQRPLPSMTTPMWTGIRFGIELVEPQRRRPVLLHRPRVQTRRARQARPLGRAQEPARSAHRAPGPEALRRAQRQLPGVGRHPVELPLALPPAAVRDRRPRLLRRRRPRPGRRAWSTSLGLTGDAATGRRRHRSAPPSAAAGRRRSSASSACCGRAWAWWPPSSTPSTRRGRSPGRGWKDKLHGPGLAGRAPPCCSSPRSRVSAALNFLPALAVAARASSSAWP